MTGLIVLGVAIPLVLGYIWLLRAAVRLARRKTGSNFAVALVVAGILAITFGDTIFNRWYHKQVLCKKEDIGIQIVERIRLPEEYVNVNTRRPNFPLPLDRPFFNRFSLLESRTSAGFFPLTAYGRIERSLLDNESGKVLARFVDYWPAGGPWWATPITWLDESSVVGWLHSRRTVSRCSDDPNKNRLLGVSDYFYAIDQSEFK